VRLQLNSLGTIAERLIYREALVTYFQLHLAVLDEDSLRRLTANPLRILDTKNPAMQEVVANAPELMDYLGEESRAHFYSILETLNTLDVAYEINTRLVRGLDYYSKTVFEWVTDELGSQGTICAGGRYDGLIEQLGGKANHAVGFAMGMERLLLLLETIHVELDAAVNVYVIRVGDQAQKVGLHLAEQLRSDIPTLKLQLDCAGGSIKSQFKKADKSGATYALILGEDEVSRGEIAIKSLRDPAQAQQNLPLNEIAVFIKTLNLL
jgi:histidyl-tRNA synthetase